MRSVSAGIVVLIASLNAFAQAPAQAPSPTGGLLGFLPMMVIMFVIIYFLMIRPEQRKQKDRQKMVDNVQKGDKVVTVGGIIGTVGNVKESSIMIKVADDTVIEFRKAAVAEVLKDKTEAAPQKGVKS